MIDEKYAVAKLYLFTLCVGEKEITSQNYRQHMTKAQAQGRNAALAAQGSTSTRWKLCWWAR